ncbi:hypothetical protein [Bradyrhizobium sp. NAS96.2]|uniref:RHS repeat domain-containing protein n=1 Tax=Bradyrhizobium sp. NAS96.2 TaxID=1680160 RepID=UPI001AECF264|nr:hypothetical protein [Bradyrhizobium sp. NAS96.2]
MTAEITSPGAPAQRWTEYLSVSGSFVDMRSTASAMTALRYFHPDHLGSISVITNETGAVVERLSYDAWGKRRNPDGSDDPSGGLTSQTNRGFTGEEQLSVAGLVHLNGRVYDPLTARMSGSLNSYNPAAHDGVVAATNAGCCLLSLARSVCSRPFLSGRVDVNLHQLNVGTENFCGWLRFSFEPMHL